MATRYVDLSATNNGDGTTAAQAGSPGGTGAWNSLATMVAGVSSGDVVYIRRVTATSTLSSSTTVPSGVTVQGWPKSGDTLYSGRPASGTSNGWDSDGADYPDWTYTTAASGLIVASNNVTLDRLKVQNSASSGNPVCFSHTGGSGLSVTNCYFKNTSTSGVVGHNCVKATPGAGVTATYRNCTIELDKANDTSGALLTVNGQCVFIGTTLILTTLNTSTSGTYPVWVNTSGTNSVMLNTTLTIGTASGTSEGILLINALCVIRNFTVTHTTRTGTSNVNPVLSVTVAAVIYGFSTTLGGWVQISANGCELEISNWTQRQANTSGGIQITGSGNTVVVNGCTFISGNTAGDIYLNSSAHGNTILARGTVFVVGVIAAVNTGTKVYSFDHNQTANNLRMQFFNGTIVASTVNRSGGESFSLQVSPTDQATGGMPMMISPRGRETIWLALASGARTVTMYFACKNVSPDRGDVWIETEYKDNSHKPVLVTSVSPGTALTSDSSTWNNDSGLTIFKIALSFTLPSDQAIPVRIGFAKYAASAYYYVDPKPETT